jgi:hypothetical protein
MAITFSTLKGVAHGHYRRLNDLKICCTFNLWMLLILHHKMICPGRQNKTGTSPLCSILHGLCFDPLSKLPWLSLITFSNELVDMRSRICNWGAYKQV